MVYGRGLMGLLFYCSTALESQPPLQEPLVHPGYSIFSQAPTSVSLLNGAHFKRGLPPLHICGGLYVLTQASPWFKLYGIKNSREFLCRDKLHLGIISVLESALFSRGVVGGFPSLLPPTTTNQVHEKDIGSQVQGCPGHTE